MMEDEFEVYIGHGKNMEDDPGQMLSVLDTYAEWQQKLSAVGLEGILTNSYESIRVQNYIEKNIPIRLQGRPIQNWHNTGKGNSFRVLWRRFAESGNSSLSCWILMRP